MSYRPLYIFGVRVPDADGYRSDCVTGTTYFWRNGKNTQRTGLKPLATIAALLARARNSTSVLYVFHSSSTNFLLQPGTLVMGACGGQPRSSSTLCCRHRRHTPAGRYSPALRTRGRNTRLPPPPLGAHWRQAVFGKSAVKEDGWRVDRPRPAQVAGEDMPKTILKSQAFLAAVLLLLPAGLGAQTEPVSLGKLLEPSLQSPEVTTFQLRQYLLKKVPKLPATTTAEEWTKEAGVLRENILRKVVFHGWPRGNSQNRRAAGAAWGRLATGRRRGGVPASKMSRFGLRAARALRHSGFEEM